MTITGKFTVTKKTCRINTETRNQIAVNNGDGKSARSYCEVNLIFLCILTHKNI